MVVDFQGIGMSLVCIVCIYIHKCYTYKNLSLPFPFRSQFSVRNIHETLKKKQASAQTFLVYHPTKKAEKKTCKVQTGEIFGHSNTEGASGCPV